MKKPLLLAFGALGVIVATPLLLKKQKQTSDENQTLQAIQNTIETKTARTQEQSPKSDEMIEKEILAEAQALVDEPSPKSLKDLTTLIKRADEGSLQYKLLNIARKLTYQGAASDVLKAYATEASHNGVQSFYKSVLADTISSKEVPQLLETYESLKGSDLQSGLAEALEGASPQAMSALHMLIQQDYLPATHGLVRSTATALKRIGNAPATDALIARLDTEPSEKGQLRFAEEVSEISNPTAEQSLLNALRGNQISTQPHTQLATIRALIKYPSAQTQSLLRELSQDSDNEEIKRASEEAMEAIQYIFENGL